MTNQQEVVTWFRNANSVMRNLGAFTMAMNAMQNGTSYAFRYKSPTYSKGYGAQSLMNILTGRKRRSYDATDREYRKLVLQQANIVRLYNGLLMAQMARGEGKTFNTTFVSTTRPRNKRTYGTDAIITLYSRSQNKKGKLPAYPL